MMFIKDSLRDHDLTWHIGEPLPEIFGKVTLIQVDDHELEYVRNFFPHLTPVNTRVALFKDELAQHIYSNIHDFDIVLVNRVLNGTNEEDCNG